MSEGPHPKMRNGMPKLGPRTQRRPEPDQRHAGACRPRRRRGAV